MSLFSYFKYFFSSQSKPKSLHGLTGIDYADTVFYNLIVEQKVPGMAITVLQKGEIVLQKGYGHANLELKNSVDPRETILRIASISKCITGLAFGKMVEDGMLNWDDSFYMHVPYFPKKKYDFTLRQLAAHTAGIRSYRGKEYALNEPYSIKESIEVFKNDPLVFEPGKGYLYNSFDSVLLSLAMQEASGIPFEQYVKEMVLNPLEMENTITPRESPTGLDAPISTFYTKRVSGFREAVEVDNFYKLAGGGYLSTSDDIAKLGQAILERRLLKKETYDQLLSSQMVHGNPTYYGLGFQVSLDFQGRHFVGHVGSSVGSYTNFFVYPEEKLVISILINCTDTKVQTDLDRTIHEILLKNLYS